MIKQSFEASSDAAAVLMLLDAKGIKTTIAEDKNGSLFVSLSYGKNESLCPQHFDNYFFKIIDKKMSRLEQKKEHSNRARGITKSVKIIVHLQPVKAG